MLHGRSVQLRVVVVVVFVLVVDAIVAFVASSTGAPANCNDVFTAARDGLKVGRWGRPQVAELDLPLIVGGAFELHACVEVQEQRCDLVGAHRVPPHHPPEREPPEVLLVWCHRVDNVAEQGIRQDAPTLGCAKGLDTGRRSSFNRCWRATARGRFEDDTLRWIHSS